MLIIKAIFIDLHISFITAKLCQNQVVHTPPSPYYIWVHIHAFGNSKEGRVEI